MKPYGVLFANKECDFYKPEEPEDPEEAFEEDAEDETAEEYLERLYGIRFDDEEGRWVTTEKDHKIHINSEGVPDKGNPFVLAVMQGRDPKTVKTERSSAGRKDPVGKRSPEQIKTLRTNATGAYTKYREACVDATKALEQYKHAQLDIEYAKTMEHGAEGRTQTLQAKVKRGEKKLQDLLGGEDKTVDLDQFYQKTSRIADSLAETDQRLNELTKMEERGLISKDEPELKNLLKRREKLQADLAHHGEIFAAYTDLEVDKDDLAKTQSKLSEWREQVRLAEAKEAELRPEKEKAERDRQAAKEARDRAVLELIPSPDYCESTEDVRDYLAAKGYIKADDTSSSPDGIDDNISFEEGQISIQNAVDVAKRMDSFFDDYPKLKGMVTSVQTVHEGKGVYASISKSTETFGLSLSGSYYASDKLAKSYSENVEDGYHPQGTDHTSIIDHEMTHFMEGALERVYQGDGKPADEVMRRVMTRIEGSYNSRKEQTYRKMVSRYAAENEGTYNGPKSKEYGRNAEWLAEAMAEARCSKEPRELSKVVREEFEGLLKEYDLM